MAAVLVTGASGFIGRATCSEFARRGWQVRAAVRRSDADVVGEPVIGRLESDAQWPMAGVDTVVHLAGIAHQLHGQNAESVYQELNCTATERLARAAARAGVRRFVFMSSIKVNGERTPADRPFRPDDAPAPQDRYARSKWNAERALAKVAAGTALETVVVRPPLVYGPGVRANFLRLIRLVERRWPLPVGGVANRRSMIYVRNLAELIVLAASSDAAAGKTFLASDAEPLSTPQLINEIARALGQPARLLSAPVALLKFAGAATGMLAEVGRLVDSLVVDSTQAREALGWAPSYSARQGIEETVRWYRSLSSGG